MTQLENIIENIIKDYPYPKYLGDDLYQITPELIGNSNLLEEIDKEMLKHLKGE